MNFLKNKDLLRDLLKFGDLTNTLHGGVVQTEFTVTALEENIVIRISAPSVPAKAFSIALNFNKLTLFSTLHTGHKEGKDRISIPMFITTYNVPATVDTDRMEAFYGKGELKIILPYKSHESLHRMVPIKSI